MGGPVEAMCLQKQSSVWYGALQAHSPPSTREKEPTQSRLAPQPKTADRLCWGDKAMPDKFLASWGSGKKEGFSLPPSVFDFS